MHMILRLVAAAALFAVLALPTASAFPPWSIDDSDQIIADMIEECQKYLNRQDGGIPGELASKGIETVNCLRDFGRQCSMPVLPDEATRFTGTLALA